MPHAARIEHECAGVSNVGPAAPASGRVLGVLVEKAKTTPEYYPLTVAAIVTGCNQKSNRDPVTNYDADDVEEILQDLRHKGAAVMVEAGGRVVRWKHTLYDWLKVEQGRARGDRRADAPRSPDRGRPPRPGEPDGADRRPAGAPDRARGPGVAGTGDVSLAPGHRSAAWSSRTGSIRPPRPRRCGSRSRDGSTTTTPGPTKAVCRRWFEHHRPGSTPLPLPPRT